MMDVVHTHGAGIDVHKKTAVVAVSVPNPAGGWYKETHTFGTMTADLLKLSDWLTSQSVTHVAMESTGEYWKPVFNILEANFEVLLVNAQHIKAVPGRRTDVNDAEWLAELLKHGLLRASFVPPAGQRDLRELTRYRTTFVRERATLVNRVHKALESANIKLTSVAIDVTGVSGRAILAELIQRQATPEQMAELAKGRLRAKRDDLIKALEGRVKPHHRFVLTELLCQIDNLDDAIDRFDQQIQEYCRPFEEAVQHLDTIPGVAREAAEIIVAEIGTDMSHFPSADHLSAWADASREQDAADGAHQAAHAAARTKNTYLAAQYHRLAARRGKKKASMAVAHSILVIAYHLISRQEDYRELGGDYFDKRRPEATAKHLIKRLEALGYTVNAQAQPTTAAA
jgi:transposase